MMPSMKGIVPFLFILLLVSPAGFASDFTVGDVQLSSTNWGWQKAFIKFTNNIPDYKFISAVAEVKFPEVPSVSSRTNRINFIIKPADTLKPEPKTLTLPYEIPTSYGKGELLITLYNVVDTLDILLESQLIFHKDFSFFVDTADGFREIVRTGLQVPLLVGQTPLFDGYFTRAMSLLLHRGKSLQDLAELCGLEHGYVEQKANELLRRKYFSVSNQKFTPAFAIIEEEDLNVLLPEIDKTVSELHDIIAGNLKSYDETLKSMAAGGKLTDDPNELLDGGSVLYHKHPSILGLLLWYKLGPIFVNDGQAFNIFENSQQGKADMGDYMYLVEGDKSLEGSSFYFFLDDARGERIYCGIVDRPFVKSKKARKSGDLPGGWDFDNDNQPVFYSFNENTAEKPLAILMQDVPPVMDHMKAVVDGQVPPEVNGNKRRGARYWCWNLIVSRLVDKFEKEKIIEKEGPGLYMFQKVSY